MTVTLNVNASTANVITNENVDTYCNFGQTSGTNEDFLITVNTGETITWEGEATPSSVNVNITKIVYEGGNNIFGGNGTVNGNGDTIKEKVIANVPSNAGGDNETYKIFFTVSNQRGVLNIDPKISVRPPTT
jgi:hypothetical protein